MVAKIMRKVLASIALVSVLSAQIISTNALSLSEDLTSETVNRTAVMLSAEEKKATVGENAEALLGDFFIGQKGLAETDLTGGAYVEFQLSVSGYDKIEALVDETVSAEVNKKLPDALKEALKGVEGDEAIAATTEQVTAAVTADANIEEGRALYLTAHAQAIIAVGGGSVTCDFFDQIKGDGVTDVRIIKADEKRVAQDDNFNWGKVTGWNLQFGEKVVKIAAGDAFDAEIGVKNLRTAFFRPVPNVPSSALDVLEFEPFFRSLGKGDPSATGAWSFDIFMNVNLEAADEKVLMNYEPNEEEALDTFRPGDILVIPQTSNNLLPLLKEAAGIITEAGGMNSHAAIVGMALEKPVLVNAHNATKILKSGTTVTLDAERGIVMFGNGKK